jgi:glycolate oxidase FAD binding subunit
MRAMHTHIELGGGLRHAQTPQTILLARGVEKRQGLFAASRQTLGDVDKQVGVYTPLNAVQQRIQNELKKQFDPAGIFNPGRA